MPTFYNDGESASGFSLSSIERDISHQIITIMILTTLLQSLWYTHKIYNVQKLTWMMELSTTAQAPNPTVISSIALRKGS